MVLLTVTDMADNLRLQFAFEPQSGSNAPPLPAQIGAFVQALYEFGTTVPVALFTAGSLTAQPI